MAKQKFKTSTILLTAQEKLPTSTHFMNDVIAFFATSNQALQKCKKAISFLLSEQQNMHKIFSTLTFQEQDGIMHAQARGR